MVRKVFNILGWIVLAVFLVGTLAFTSTETKNITCSGIDILYDDRQSIAIDKEEVLGLVKNADNKVLEKNLAHINAELIEKAVEKHQVIEKAEVYKMAAKQDYNYKGILAVKIKHREPLVRIISSSGSYYLDNKGEKFPVSTKYTANVLVVSGAVAESFAKKELLEFVSFIEKDAFWKAQVEQIHVSSSNELVLVPLVGEHFVDFGKVGSYKEKLRNLKAFYEQVLAQGNWNKYKRINLKYKDQVIGKKR